MVIDLHNETKKIKLNSQGYKCNLFNNPIIIKLDVGKSVGIIGYATIQDLINNFATVQDIINSFETVQDILDYKVIKGGGQS